MSQFIAQSFGVGSMDTPLFAPMTVSGVQLDAYHLTVYDYGGQQPLVINGNSLLVETSSLTTQGQGTGSMPPAPLMNNGFMSLRDSSLTVGALGGHGSILATRSTIHATSAATSETFQLAGSSYLDIGNSLTGANPGMQFLAPIKGFDKSDTINLEDTHATMEVYFRASGALFLFDGSKMVADLHVTGSPTIYATQNNFGPGAVYPSVSLSTTNPFGHALAHVFV